MKQYVIRSCFIILFFIPLAKAQKFNSQQCEQIPLHLQYLASLAVASANELGRWNIPVDYQWTGHKLTLSPTGLARCKNKCENIKAILDLQRNESRNILYHEPTLFRDYLVKFYYDQLLFNQNHTTETHTLVPLHISEDKNKDCGLRHHYLAIKGDKFSIIKHLDKHSRTDKDLKNLPAKPLKNPGLLKNQLLFAGGEQNYLLRFQHTSTEVSIDPMATLVSGGSRLSAGCYGNRALFEDKADISGKCCMVNGVYGKFARAAFNKKIFICKT